MTALPAAARLTSLFGKRELVHKPKKPPEIVYGVEDVPPLTVTLLSAMQHAGNLSTSIITAIAILHLGHVSDEFTVGIVGLGFLGLALAPLIQALPRGPIGSGYLAPSWFNGLFIAPSVAAIQLGGLSLMCGMTVFAGFVEAALSRIVRHLRPYLPPEIAGAVTFLLGLNSGMLGLRDLLGFGFSGAVPLAHYAVAIFTLALIVVLNVWTSGLLRMASVLVGLVLGYVLAFVTGLVPVTALSANPAPILALPAVGNAGLAFDVRLVPAFLIVALISSIKAIAVTTACQRTNDAAYIRPDLGTLNRGVLADGIVTTIGGLIGTPGFNLAPSSPGLAAATGVTSRRVAYAISGVFAVLAFSPAAASLFARIPDAVAGSVMVFSACFVITSGVEVMASRLLDSRRMLVVASAILAANGAEAVAASAGKLPAAMQQITASPLLLGTMVALTLNLVFLPRTRRNTVLTLDPAQFEPQAVHDFIDARGAAWGARADVIHRIGFALAELVDSLVQRCHAEGPIRIETRFSEFRVDLLVTYRGALIQFPAVRPSLDEIADDPEGLLRLSGFLVRRQTDAVRSLRRGDDCVVEMSFDH